MRVCVFILALQYNPSKGGGFDADVGRKCCCSQEIKSASSKAEPAVEDACVPSGSALWTMEDLSLI